MRGLAASVLSLIAGAAPVSPTPAPKAPSVHPGPSPTPTLHRPTTAPAPRGPTTAPAAVASAGKSAARVPATEPATRPAATQPATRPAPPPKPDYAADAAQALAQTVRAENDPQVVAAAAQALCGLGAKAEPALSKLQADKSSAVRARVVEIAAGMNDPAGSVPLLVAAMKDPDVSVRAAALAHLRLANASDPRAVRAAAEALHDPDPDMRQAAGEYLTNLGENAAPAAALLAASLDARSIQILAGIGPGAEPAVPALLAYYQDPRRPSELRVEAVMAISRILGKAPATAPAGK